MAPAHDTTPVHVSLAKVSSGFFCEGADHNTAVNLNGKLIKADSCTSSSWSVALSPRKLPHAEGREGEGKKQVTPIYTPIIGVHQSEGGVIKEGNDKEHPSLGHPLTATTAADLFQADRIV